MNIRNDKWSYLRDNQGRYKSGKFWTSVVYQDNIGCVDDIKKLLIGKQFLISPLHNEDKYVEGDRIPDGKSVGDFKKPHWHIIFWNHCRVSPKGYFDLIDGFNFVGLERVEDIYQYLHYLLHDGYDYTLTGKQTYQFEDFVASSNQVDYTQYFQYDATDVNIFQLCEFIDVNGFTTFKELVNFLKLSGNTRYLHILFTHSYFFNCYMR